MGIVLWKPLNFLQRDEKHSKVGGRAVYQTVLTTGAMVLDITDEEKELSGVDVGTEAIRVQVRRTPGVAKLNYAIVTHARYEDNQYTIASVERGITGQSRNFETLMLKRDK